MLGLLTIALLAQAPYYADEEAKALFSQGNDAYAQGDYKKARETFEKLIDHGLGTQEVLYNAGTAALAEGNRGLSILYLEKALLVSGSGETSDVEANLSMARSKQLDQVVGAGTERTFIQRLAIATDEHAAAIALIVCMWVGFGALLLTRVLKSSSNWMLTVVGLACLIVAVPAAGLVAVHAWVDHNVKEGVVVADTVAARELPRPSAKVSFEIHAGLKLRVLESQDDFVKVRLPNGLEGWAERKGIADL